MAEVRTRDEAINSVDQALQAWSTDVTGILTLAQSVARAANDEAEAILRKRAIEVAAIEALLTAADSNERRRLQADLTRAKDVHEQARRACGRVNNVAATISQLSRKHTTLATSQVASARAQLSNMSRSLEDYRSSGAVHGGGGSSGRSTTSTGEPLLASWGLADLDVSSADLEDNPILDDNGSQGTFGKGGLSRADYRWAVQTWNDTVGPGLAGGQTREDFAERDARSNAQPLRRTADVYDSFLGSDRIRADHNANGSLNIINGRHRLLIARELGIKTLPGQVS